MVLEVKQKTRVNRKRRTHFSTSNYTTRNLTRQRWHRMFWILGDTAVFCKWNERVLGHVYVKLESLRLIWEGWNVVFEGIISRNPLEYHLRLSEPFAGTKQANLNKIRRRPHKFQTVGAAHLPLVPPDSANVLRAWKSAKQARLPSKTLFLRARCGVTPTSRTSNRGTRRKRKTRTDSNQQRVPSATGNDDFSLASKHRSIQELRAMHLLLWRVNL